MLKEKLNLILKNDGNPKKKIENLIFFLIILIVTIVSMNFIWKDHDQTKSDESISSKKLASENNTKEDDSLELKLENILSDISGVGSVKVLLTYSETEELVPLYNKMNKTSTTNEVDSQGGTRSIEESDTSTEIVYQNNEIVTQKMINPKIEGAIIAATRCS